MKKLLMLTLVASGAFAFTPAPARADDLVCSLTGLLCPPPPPSTPTTDFRNCDTGECE